MALKTEYHVQSINETPHINSYGLMENDDNHALVGKGLIQVEKYTLVIVQYL